MRDYTMEGVINVTTPGMDTYAVFERLSAALEQMGPKDLSWTIRSGRSGWLTPGSRNNPAQCAQFCRGTP